MNKREVQGKDKFLVRWKGFTAKGDTWKSRENLENVGDLLKEFEEKYNRNNRKVRQQEKVENNKEYWRGGFPGRYAIRRLFGWLDKEYNRQYWQRLECNWKCWKNVKLAGGVKGRLTAVCGVVEEEREKIKE